VSEYLTNRQKQMMAQRNGPINTANAFNNKWSGFDKVTVAPAIKRRLRGTATAETPSHAGAYSVGSVFQAFAADVNNLVIAASSSAQFAVAFGQEVVNTVNTVTERTKNSLESIGK
jgi:hypothetical protein